MNFEEIYSHLKFIGWILGTLLAYHQYIYRQFKGKADKEAFEREISLKVNKEVYVNDLKNLKEQRTEDRAEMNAGFKRIEDSIRDLRKDIIDMLKK